jgi:Spy/CpxP family protein refolding chaperone
MADVSKRTLELQVVPLLLVSIVFSFGFPSAAAPSTKQSETKQPATKPPVTKQPATKLETKLPATKQTAAKDESDQSEDELASEQLRKGRHHGRHKGGGAHRRRDGVPSFRSVKQLDSLTPVQSGKINRILKEYREVMAPLAGKYRAYRKAEEGSGSESTPDAGRAMSMKDMREQIHILRSQTWVKIQKILTPSQKAELQKQPRGDRGPHLHHNPNALPSEHDSGRSFSK